jgi:hypothetical protein
MSYQPQSQYQSQYQSQLQSEPHSSPICLIPKHQLKRMHSNPIAPTLEPVTTNTNPNAGKDHTDLTNLLHDDIDVTDSPEQHVDYLTHKWKEDEISKSWKYVTLRRSAVADSARLENASWRTWAQTRLGLKTISPEELNWSKDSDVTWLYGPVIKSTTSNATLNDDSCPQGMNRNASDEQLMTGGTDSIMTDATSNATIIGAGGTNTSTSTSTGTGTVTGIDIGIGTATGAGTGTGTTDTVMTDGDNDHHLDNKHTNTHNSNVTVRANDNDHQANENDQSLLNNTHHTEHTEHLKSILKKKSNVEKMISDASYSRLQHLLENREIKLRGADSSSVTPSASPSPMLEPTVPGEVTDMGTGSGTGKESSSATYLNHRVDVPSPLISHVNSPLLSATSPAFSVSTSPASGSPTSAQFSTQHQQQHQQQHQRPILPSRIKSSLKTSLFGTHTSLSPSLKPVEKKKQIHFNMRVDQCVAVIQDEYTSDANTNTDVDLIPSAGEEDEREEDADEDDEKSLAKRTLQNMHFSLESSDSDSDWNSDSDSNTNTNSNTINVNDNANLNNEDVELTDLHKQQHQMRGTRRNNRGSRRRRTIAPLPATTLKFGSDDEFEREQELERERDRERQNASQGGIMSGVSFGTPGKMYTVSHNTKTNRGYDYYYDYNTVYSNNSNPLIYSTVSNSQNKAKPVVADVQMFDVPANCQLDSVIDSNPVPSDAGPTTSTGASIVDVPASFLHDIPQDFVEYEPSGQENDGDGDGDTAMSEHIEKAVESSDSDTGSDSTSGYENYENYSDNSTPVNGGFTDLRRTTSIGSRNSSTQSLASIKVGLSGLDLTTTGLRRSDSNGSSGAGSRPQLYQLHQTTSLNRPVSGIGSNGGQVNNHGQSQGQGQGQGRKFMFDDSSSDSESDEYSGDGMDVDDDILAQAPVVPLSVRNGLVNVVRSGTSLADINQQFGTLSSANSNANSTTSINAKDLPVAGKKSAFNLMDDSESGSESESD